MTMQFIDEISRLHTQISHLRQINTEMYEALKKIYDKEGWVWVGEVLAKAERRS